EGRDDERGYPRPVAAHGRPVVGCLRRRYVVVEAAVLVVGDDQQRLRPGRAAGERVEELQHELLAGPEVHGRVVVVGTGRPEGEVDEVGVDPGDGRQVSRGHTLEKATVAEDVALVEVGRHALDRQ